MKRGIKIEYLIDGTVPVESTHKYVSRDKRDRQRETKREREV